MSLLRRLLRLPPKTSDLPELVRELRAARIESAAARRRIAARPTGNRIGDRLAGYERPPAREGR